MKIIKKYWAIIVGGILAFFGILYAIFTKTNNKKLDKLEEQIDTNNQQIDVLQGKTEVVEEQRVEVKKEIDDAKETVSKLQKQKKNIKIEETDSVASAKNNIVTKTKRGRKPKKK